MGKEIYGFVLLGIAFVLLLGVTPYLLWKESLVDLGISLRTTLSFNFLICFISSIVIGGNYAIVRI